MTAITGSHTATIAADPDTVFDAITDPARLPAWNTRMTHVIEAPAALTPGAEWVVQFNALGQTWQSRSVVAEIDPTARRFSYRAATDDGNPSRALWSWDVAEDPRGSRVTVRWDLHPVTFWRRVLLGRIRARQLDREVPASLAALAAVIASAPRTSTEHP
jgi:uncharacterized protein YndB with AHSA1/START domain